MQQINILPLSKKTLLENYFPLSSVGIHIGIRNVYIKNMFVRYYVGAKPTCMLLHF